MKIELPHLVNVPPFMLKGLEDKKISFLLKLYLILKGRVVSILINKVNGKSFCFFLNLLFVNDGKIFFDGRFYFKEFDGMKIYYPNKRIQRILIDYPDHLDRLLKSYSIDSLTFKDSDVDIDCGANIGELNLALKNKNINLNYFAFEPDEQSYECCILNNQDSKDNIRKIGLSDQKGKKEFFQDSFGGNSSLVSFGQQNKTIINVEKLDNLNIPEKIKLLKIDAEGYEPEVLQGCQKMLKNVEYVAVDFGPERGVKQEDTIIDVNNYLISEGFKLVKFEINRITGLYKKNTQ